MSKPIVISHAHADEPLARELVNLMATGLNITRKEIFCTSVKGSQIPSGENFLEYIRTEFKEAKVIILLITENYLASHFCVAESGASWVLQDKDGCKLIPIAVPPISKSKLKSVLAVTQGHNIGDSDSWDDIKDELLESMEGKTSTAQWNEEKQTFLDKLGDLIAALPKPGVVDPDEHEKLKKAVEYLRKQKAELEKEAEEKDNLISAMTQAESPDEARRIYRESLDEFEGLRELGAALGKAIDALPRAGREAMYYHAKSEPLPTPQFGYDDTEDRWREIREAVDLKVLADEDSLALNTAHPTVRKAIAALEELRTFMNENEEILAQELEEEWECTYDLADRTFWHNVINP